MIALGWHHVRLVNEGLASHHCTKLPRDEGNNLSTWSALRDNDKYIYWSILGDPKRDL